MPYLYQLYYNEEEGCIHLQGPHDFQVGECLTIRVGRRDVSLLRVYDSWVDFPYIYSNMSFNEVGEWMKFWGSSGVDLFGWISFGSEVKVESRCLDGLPFFNFVHKEDGYFKFNIYFEWDDRVDLFELSDEDFITVCRRFSYNTFADLYMSESRDYHFGTRFSQNDVEIFRAEIIYMKYCGLYREPLFLRCERVCDRLRALGVEVEMA
jgi:hypothetical protein